MDPLHLESFPHKTGEAKDKNKMKVHVQTYIDSPFKISAIQHKS